MPPPERALWSTLEMPPLPYPSSHRQARGFALGICRKNRHPCLLPRRLYRRLRQRDVRFQDNMAALNDADAVVLGISVDSPWANAEFARKYNLEFELLSDLNREAVQAYDAAFVGLGGIDGYMCANRVGSSSTATEPFSIGGWLKTQGLNRTTPKWFQPLLASESSGSCANTTLCSGQGSVVVIFDSLVDFLTRVHDKRPVAGNWFTKLGTSKNQQFRSVFFSR